MSNFIGVEPTYCTPHACASQSHRNRAILSCKNVPYVNLNKSKLREQADFAFSFAFTFTFTSDQRESSIDGMISNTQAKFDTCRDAIVEMHTTIETRLAPGITHLINRAILKSDGRVGGRDARLNLALSRIHRRESDRK